MEIRTRDWLTKIMTHQEGGERKERNRTTEGILSAVKSAVWRYSRTRSDSSGTMNNDTPGELTPRVGEVDEFL
jgi:hypothetical protein